MPINARKYQQLKQILDSGGELSDDVRTQALAAVQEYEDSFLNKGVGQDQPRPAAGVAPIGSQKAPSYYGNADLAQNLIARLDPSHPVQPQVLSLAPATGHPKGDKAAQDEWVRGELDNPNGLVIVYEAPVAEVRNRIMDNPQILKSLGYDTPLTTEAIMNIQPGDSIVQAYNDREWTNVADAAVKAGKTPYRYSRAPWMQGGEAAGVLDTLGTKLKTSALPAIEGATRFVMGVDSTAGFNAATSAANAGLLDEGPSPIQNTRKTAIPGAMPTGGGNDEIVGGPTVYATNEGLSGSEDMDMLREENPTAFAAGELAGIVPGAVGAGLSAARSAFAPASGAVTKAVSASSQAVERGVKALDEWNPVNTLWDWIMSTKAPQTGLKGLGANTAKMAFAGGATQAVGEGVQAAANYAGTGDAGSPLEAGVRIGEGAAAGGLFGAAAELALGSARGFGDWVRQGPRYQGIPDQLERAGLRPRFGSGYVDPPEVKAARQEARATGTTPEGVLADRVAPKLETGTKALNDDVNAAVRAENEEFHPTPEGREQIPHRNFVETLVKKLRGDLEKRVETATVGRKNVPDPVGTPDKGGDLKELLNNEVDVVTTKPAAGAIEATPEEAEAFLDSRNRSAALKSLRPQKPPKAASAPAKGRASLSPPEELPTRASSSKAPPEPTEVGVGEDVPAVRAKAIPHPGPDVRKYGTRDALPGLKPRKPKNNVRVTGPGRKQQPAEPAPERPKGFAGHLRAKGVDRVYLVPRAHSAEHAQTLIDAVGAFRGKGRVSDVDIKELDEAIRRDRDVRTKGGKPKGWSEHKNQQSERISEAQEVRRHVSPTGDAHPAALSFARGGAEVPQARAIRKAADRAGEDVRTELEMSRVPHQLDRLRKRNAVTEKRSGDRIPGKSSGVFSLLGRGGDSLVLRGVYPATRVLEGPLGAAGMRAAAGAGTRLLNADSEAYEKRKRDRDERRAPDYAAKTKEDREAPRQRQRRKRTRTRTRTRRRTRT